MTSQYNLDNVFEVEAEILYHHLSVGCPDLLFFKFFKFKTNQRYE